MIIETKIDQVIRDMGLHEAGFRKMYKLLTGDELTQNTFYKIRKNIRQITLPELVLFAKILDISDSDIIRVLIVRKNT